MNLWESRHDVDLFVICEFNRTHVGEPREFIFDRYRDQLPQELRNRIHYLPADISSHVKLAQDDDGDQMHANEAVMWDYFAWNMDLKGDDIVLCVDADEVIYQHMFARIFNRIEDGTPALLLPLHQFFYRMNYLWIENTFCAPTACRKSYYDSLPQPHRWRYEGERFPFMAGCHFSWQLTVKEMLFKLRTYAHKDIYGKFADESILSAAILEKKYPFEPNISFTIQELDVISNRSYYPQSFYVFKKDFENLLLSGVVG